MELLNFLRVLYKRKWLIIVVIVVAFALSFYSAMKAKVPKEARNVLHFSFSLPQEIDIQTDYRLRVPVEQKAFDFVALFSTERAIREGIEQSGVDISTYAAARALNASVQVVKIGAEDERTSFIEVVCRHHDGDLAVKLVNGVTDAATRIFTDMLTRSVTANREFLEKQVAEYQDRISIHEQRLREFLAEHPGFGQTADDESIATRKVQLDFSESNLAAEVAGLDAKIRLTSEDLEEFRSGSIAYIPPAIKYNENLETLQNKLLGLQFEYSQMIGRYSDSHPVVKRLLSEIGMAREELRVEAIRLLEEELEVYKALRQERASQLTSFQNVVSDLLQDTDEFAVDRIEYNRVVKDLTIDQESYARVKTKLAEAIIEENKAKEQYTVDIIESAETAQPRRELWFQPGFRVALAVIGSVFFALILALFIEYVTVKGVEAAGPLKPD